MPRKAHKDSGRLECSAVTPGTVKVKSKTVQVDAPPIGQSLEDDRLAQREFERRRDQRRAHSVKQVEEILGVGHSTLYGLFNSGALKARKLLGKTIVLDSDLQAFLAALPSAFPGQDAA